MNQSDQWLHDGDCSKCRRKKYCSKMCLARNRAMDREMREKIYRTAFGIHLGATERMGGGLFDESERD